ncbi:MAG: hypothetical protein ABR499_16625 [Gemmatimonadaceae bacterium]
MRTLAAGLTAITLLVITGPFASAQARPIELGIDAALSFGLDEPRVTVIAIPFQQFRVGFFTSPRTSFEPTLAINHVDIDDPNGLDLDATTISIGLGVLFHLTPDRTQSQIYFRPFGGFTSVSAFGESESDPNLGLGLGLKTPFANRLATRLEAFVAHQFDGDGTTSVGVLFGLSFFPR